MNRRLLLDRVLVSLALVLLFAVLVYTDDLVVTDPCVLCNVYPLDSWSYAFCRWLHSCVGGGGW